MLTSLRNAMYAYQLFLEHWQQEIKDNRLTVQAEVVMQQFKLLEAEAAKSILLKESVPS